MEYIIGAALGLGVPVGATFIHFDRDRAFYPLMTIVTASYYVLFAVLGGSLRALSWESMVMFAFIAAAVAGFKTNLWIVVAALIAHGLLDIFHTRLISNPGVPSWWPMFCLSYDIVAATYLSWLLTRPYAIRAADMGSMSNVDIQLAAATAFAGRGEFQRCFEYLERAHILAQTSTYQHVRVHWLMLRWAIGQRNVTECLGQIGRIVGAASKTALGLVPVGNTGGSNVGAFRSMPVPADLAVLLPPRRSRCAFFIAIVVIAGLLLVASAVVGIGTRASAQTALINGRPMTFRVVGSGRPAIVFIAGLGDGMATFDQVATELGKNATVITYDRAGYGGSQAVRESRDAQDAERDLFSLLAQTGVPGPYVLVGHSLGGLYAEYYASKHPTQIAGLILEESRPADFSRRCERLPDKPMCMVPAWLGWMMPTGVQYELAGLEKATAQVSQSEPLTGTPVLVLSRSRGKERSSFDELWAVAQNDLAARYPGSEQVIAPGNSHYIHRDQQGWFLAAIHPFMRQVNQGR